MRQATSTWRRSRFAVVLGAIACPAAVLAQATSPLPLAHAAPYSGASSTMITVPAYRDAILAGRNAVADYLTKRGVPGAAVALSIGGVLIWSEGFGLADVEQGVPVTPSTRFRSGSVAKPISTAIAARLHDMDRLDFDTPVQKLVPTFPVRSKPITFRMLVGMLSGLRHYRLGTDDFFNSKKYDDVLQYVDTFKNDPLVGEPGAQFFYSSPGVNLAGAMTQAAGGKPFPVLAQELVFGPLGMTATTLDRNEDIIPQRTRFYERTGGERTYRIRTSSWGNGERGILLNAPYSDNSNKFPSGGYLTTPEDLLRFGNAMLSPGFLKAGTLTELFTEQHTSSGKATGYGMSWFLDKDERGDPIYWHSGSSVGGNSMLILYPRQKLVIAMQTNLTDSNMGQLPRRLAKLFMK